ncbi:PucR family transcriptional regulator [Nocardioides seonyuensis]|uniref:PucR family transcriptional regulator n=1 Tax=Nocardioides seonyuensis TaxID=2518371 RepID=A0A4V1BLZ1_9ACTN|nr:PucR family transcriptional regulator [Nocardioides seonyuensis]QBX54552.1 PucR family transcriptional regulator [Nocardioides seonyuensis]
MTAPRADLPSLLRVLPPTVPHRLQDVQATLLERVVDAAHASSQRQGRPLDGAAGRGIQAGTRAAVEAFVALVADPGHELGPVREVFRQLGREEFRDGRFIDALRSTLVAGTQAMWSVLVELGEDSSMEPRHLHVLAGALLPFLDELSAAAAEGYLEEQTRASLDLGMTRRGLVSALVGSNPVDETRVRTAAEAARWPVPERVGVLVVEGADADQLARMVSADSIGATLEDVAVVVVPRADSAGRLTRVRRAVKGRRAAVGVTVPLVHAQESHRQAARGLRLLHAGVLPDTDLVVCADHLLTLILGWEEGLADEFATSALAPLLQVEPGHRRTLEATLLTWLREQGRVVATAEAMHAHPQTIRYRVRQLKALFGPALEDSDERYRLESALRWRVLSPG